MRIWKHLGALALCSAASTLTGNAAARSGTHATPVSTWDTRASTVVGAFRYGIIDGGQLMQISYNANFTSTTGNLSAQFGLHYMNFQEPPNPDLTIVPPLAHGIAGTAAAVFSIPVTERYDNGIPKAALGFYIGGAPTGLIGGDLNYVTVPLTFGLGMPYTPHPVISLVPWVEVAPNVNVDTHFVDTGVTIPASAIDPNNPTELQLGPEQVADVLSQGVELQVALRVNMRAGLQTMIHLGESTDLNAYFNVGSLDSVFTGPIVVTLGGGLVIRWDDVVPAALPAAVRLQKIDCASVEERFLQCPNGKRWQDLEQRQRMTPAAPAPTATPPAAPAAPPPQPAVEREPNTSGFPYTTPTAPAPTAPQPKPPQPTPPPALPPQPTPANTAPAPAPQPPPPPPPEPAEPPAGSPPTKGFPPPPDTDLPEIPETPDLK